MLRWSRRASRLRSITFLLSRNTGQGDRRSPSCPIALCERHSGFAYCRLPYEGGRGKTGDKESDDLYGGFASLPVDSTHIAGAQGLTSKNKNPVFRSLTLPSRFRKARRCPERDDAGKSQEVQGSGLGNGQDRLGSRDYIWRSTRFKSSSRL